MRYPITLCLLAVLSCSPILADDAETAPAEARKSEITPGQLDVVEMTAVELDGRLPDGVDPVSFHWKIIEGEGGKLFGDDQASAVFLAPKVEKGVKQFVVEVHVTYAAQPPSTRSVRIRVVPTDPAAAGQGSDEGTEWLDDFYDDAREIEEKKNRDAGTTVIIPGNTGSSMMIGIGAGGYHGGRVGFRWTMGYPISQPVALPPPGETRGPGEGQWDVARPVPYDELHETFPSSIADRYRPVEQTDPEGSVEETQEEQEQEREEENED